jgi:PST family polysaccharide transporter
MVKSREFTGGARFREKIEGAALPAQPSPSHAIEDATNRSFTFRPLGVTVSAMPMVRGWSPELNLRHYFVRPLFRNALSLYCAQFAGYVVPLVTIPYLARILLPGEFGVLVFAQSFAVWMSLLVDYGFNLSGTREVARLRDKPDGLASLVAGVMGAKALLGVAGLAVSLGALVCIDAFRVHPKHIAFGAIYAFSQGLSPLWYHQGRERMIGPVLTDTAGRLLPALSVFAFVHGPEHGWRVLGAQAVGSLVATGVLISWVYQSVRWERPTWKATTNAFRNGWLLFVAQGAISLYTAANSFILGLFAAPVQVGYYGGAERISRAASGLLGPASRALYPRMSHLVATDSLRARSLGLRSMLIMGSVGLLLGTGLGCNAPLLVRGLLGPGYEQAAALLAILAWALPCIALSNVFGIQWMLPLGLDHSFNRIFIVAGLLSLLAASLFSHTWGPFGMAWVVVGTEAFVTGATFWALWRRGVFRRVPALPSVVRSSPI